MADSPFDEAYILLFVQGSELIFIHNNVTISRNVDFVAHDGINFTLNKLPEDQRMDYQFKERIQRDHCLRQCGIEGL